MRKRDLHREVERFMEVYNAAWERNWGFVPLTENEVRHYAKTLKPLLDENWAMIAEKDGEVVGAALTLPDVDQALARMKGRVLPTGWWHFLRRKTYIDRLRVFALGVLPALAITSFGFWRFGRGLETRYDREYEQEPPTDTAPALVPTLLRQGGEAGSFEFTATLFDLIRRGHYQAEHVTTERSIWAGLRTERVSDLEELVRALHEVARGGSSLDPRVVEGLLARKSAEDRSPLLGLTDREREVLQEWWAGMAQQTAYGAAQLPALFQRGGGQRTCASDEQLAPLSDALTQHLEAFGILHRKRIVVARSRLPCADELRHRTLQLGQVPAHAALARNSSSSATIAP